jgi:hypothetical protein
MAQDSNNRKSQAEQLGDQQKGKSGRRQGKAPQTTATGGQNNGGQTQRATDKPGGNKRGSGS